MHDPKHEETTGKTLGEKRDVSMAPNTDPVTPRVFAHCHIELITHLIMSLNHFDDHRSTLVKTLAQNPSYSFNLLCHSRTLARSPKISLSTPKPPKEKNVQNVEGHNFAVEWHWKFGRIHGETGLGRCPAPVHGAEFSAMLAWRSCFNPWTKPLQAFVKVIEESLISNFASDTKVQCSLENWRKTNLKIESGNTISPRAQERVQRATSRAATSATAVRAVPTSGAHAEASV
jgi:hypothetical protein